MLDPKIVITPDILKLIAEIDEFKGRWDSLGRLSRARLGQLRKVAAIESIGSSTRIEGSKLSDAQVETLLANISVQSFRTRDEQEVAGYAEAMDLVFQSHEDISLTENHIRQLHQILLRHSTKDERHRGSYKTLPNHVVALDASGREIGIVFETATPFETPRQMEELVAWTSKAIREQSLHPLLSAAIFVVAFLAIHPFQDGNGRLSRILTTLLLLRAGYSYVPYSSLESVIEENKDIYYRSLRRTQTTLKNTNPDWQPWLGFFLRCLKKQQDNLKTRIAADARGDVAEMPALSARIVDLLCDRRRLTSAELRALTGANPSTLKLRLRDLLASGHIARHGKARATWYSPADTDENYSTSAPTPR